ncbi:MAG: FHA domain-containing protein [Firmicutes bacterium]|nr:FHA domain-containing protein [Bacillota bacterium]
MKCTICGADNLEGAAYCEDCGSKLPVTQIPMTPASPPPQPVSAPAPVAYQEPVVAVSQPSAGDIVCPSCGAENPSGSKFCDDCGASLEAATAPAAQAPVYSAPPVVQQQAPAVVYPKLIADGTNVEFILDKDIITMGRQSPADGIFPDVDLTDLDKEAYISRRHARILKRDEGFIFEDLGSSNGSFINNVRVTQGVQQFINNGDKLRLGKTALTLIKS